MFGWKTRDLIIQTATIVEGVEKTISKVDTDFQAHIKDEDEKITALHKVIVDCHGSCPEKEHFEGHTKAQNGTLLRMEKKYDDFFLEHTEVKKLVNAMKVAKKTKREMFSDWGRILTIVCVIVGAWAGYQKYCNSKKVEPIGETKIEVMLKGLLNKR